MSRPLLSLNQSIASLQLDQLLLKVDAQHGARITSLQWMGQELLTQRSEHAANFGSTLWDAPQSRWHWPPPHTLDCAPYETYITSDAIQCKSPIDQGSQLQYTKTIRALESDGVKISYGITNHSSQAISIAAWEVTRVSPGLTFLPSIQLAKDVASNLPGVIFANGCAWYRPDAATLELGKKAFFDVTAGWLAHVTPQHCMLVKTFSMLKAEQYSPTHAAVEVYGHEQAAYVELENMGPRTSLAPGESLHYDVIWRVQTIPAQVPLTAGNEALIEFAQVLYRRGNS